MGSHSVTSHPTQVRIPTLPPAEAGTQFSDPGGMQGWVDLCYVKATGRELNPRPVNRKSNAVRLSHHATQCSLFLCWTNWLVFLWWFNTDRNNCKLPPKVHFRKMWWKKANEPDTTRFTWKCRWWSLVSNIWVKNEFMVIPPTWYKYNASFSQPVVVLWY